MEGYVQINFKNLSSYHELNTYLVDEVAPIEIETLEYHTIDHVNMPLTNSLDMVIVVVIESLENMVPLFESLKNMQSTPLGFVTSSRACTNPTLNFCRRQ